MDMRAPACLCVHIIHRHACEKRSEEKRGEEMRREEKTQEPQREGTLGTLSPKVGTGTKIGGRMGEKIWERRHGGRAPGAPDHMCPNRAHISPHMCITKECVLRTCTVNA